AEIATEIIVEAVIEPAVAIGRIVGVEQRGAALIAADIVEAGLARQVAARSVAPRAIARCARAGVLAGESLPGCLAAIAEHRTDRIHQQAAADHAGRRRRSGAEERAAAAFA